MLLLALLAVLGSSPEPAAAVPPSAASPNVDPATLAEAVRLLDSEHFEETAMRSSEMAIEASLASLTEQLPKLTGETIPPDFVDDLRQAIRDHNRATMKAKLPAMKLEAARLYAREFTKSELIRMREIGADPVMVKARERNKILAPKMMMIGINAMREAQPELDATIKRLVADYIARLKAKPTS